VGSLILPHPVYKMYIIDLVHSDAVEINYNKKHIIISNTISRSFAKEPSKSLIQSCLAARSKKLHIIH